MAGGNGVDTRMAEVLRERDLDIVKVRNRGYVVGTLIWAVTWFGVTFFAGRHIVEGITASHKAEVVSANCLCGVDRE